jgi:chorismate synthase
MAGNTFGTLFRISTFGESHGPAIGVIIDGVPPLLDLDETVIQLEMDRRRPGQSGVTTPRNEADQVEILSGVFEGKTTGAPLAMMIRNANQRSKDYGDIKNAFRPGHADYTFQEKYGIRDYRGGGRSSGRETAARVAAGAVAKVFLATYGIKIHAYTVQIGDIQAKTIDFNEIEKNVVRCPDKIAAAEMEKLVIALRDEGDSIGGMIETVVLGCPTGLGDPVFDKLDAKLSHAIMSIGTTKGISFGDGFDVVTKKGSENNDEFGTDGESIHLKTNHAGGLLGGISNGAPIVFKVAIKPPSSISKAQNTVTLSKEAKSIEVHGRHDPCICPRVVPVIEAMTAVTIADAILVQASIANKRG